MNIENIKNKSLKDLLKISITDSVVYKSLTKLVENMENESNENILEAYKLVKKRRPSSAKLKELIAKHKIKLDMEIKPDRKPITKNPTNKEVNLKEKPKEKEKLEVTIIPFSTGSFHYNLNNEICEFLEGLVVTNTEKTNYTKYAAKILNHNTLEIYDIKWELNVNNTYYKETNNYLLKTVEIDPKDNEYLKARKHALRYSNFKYNEEPNKQFLCTPIYDFKPNIKKGILPGINAVDISISLKNINTKINKLKDQAKLNEIFAVEMNLSSKLRCNFNEVIDELTSEFLQNNGCNINGETIINNIKYKPSIYSKETLLKFCEENNLLFTEDALMSLTYLGENEFVKKLTNPSYVKFVPKNFNQTFVMIKLCVELEKTSSIKDTLSLINEEKVLYRIVKKDPSANFYFVYKEEKGIPKDSSNLSRSNLPI